MAPAPPRDQTLAHRVLAYLLEPRLTGAGRRVPVPLVSRRSMPPPYRHALWGRFPWATAQSPRLESTTARPRCAASLLLSEGPANQASRFLDDDVLDRGHTTVAASASISAPRRRGVWRGLWLSLVDAGCLTSHEHQLHRNTDLGRRLRTSELSLTGERCH